MAELVGQIVDELETYVSDLATVFGYTTGAVRLWIAQISGIQPIPENPDPCVYWSDGNPNKPDTLKFDGWRRSRILAESATNGVIVTSLSHQFIVNLYSSWEHNFRVRLARAIHCELDDVKTPFFSDIRHIRDDVVHCRGTATRENTGKCEVFQWFKEGGDIRLNAAKVRDLLEKAPWTELRALALAADG